VGKLTKPVFYTALLVSAGALVLGAAWYANLHGGAAMYAKLGGWLATELHRLIFNRILSENSAYGLTYLAGTAAVLALEIPVLGYRNSSIFRLLHPTQTTMMDIFIYVARVVGVFGLLISIFSLGLADLVPRLLQHVLPAKIFALQNPILQTVWLIIVMDFLKYWMHRLQHAVPFWWEVHKFHHAAEEMNVITTARGHPIDDAFRLIYFAAAAIVFGASPMQLVVLGLIEAVHAGLSHSMLPWNFGWVGRWILVAPTVHRVHHSPESIHYDRNFSAIFVTWDRLFGTYDTSGILNATIGVNDNPYNKNGLVRDLVDCAVRCARALLPIRRRPDALTGAAD